jgi:hypothetical protein
MLTIVFYATDGAAAKLRAREIFANKPNLSRLYEVSAWDGRLDQCDAVEIMPDVPGWQRKRIVEVYGDKVVGSAAAAKPDSAPPPAPPAQATRSSPPVLGLPGKVADAPEPAGVAPRQRGGRQAGQGGGLV